MAKITKTNTDDLNQEVLAFLRQDELDYPAGAKKFGAAALPYLEELIASNDEMLATKAAYLAGYIGGEAGSGALKKAAAAGFSTVRLAAAFGAQSLKEADATEVLSQALDDHDPGVQKIAMRSVQAKKLQAALKPKLQALSKNAVTEEIKTQASEMVKKLK